MSAISRGGELEAGHIGIVGVSAEGAALCYRTICVEGERSPGLRGHPEVTLHTYPLSTYMRHVAEGNWDRVAALMRASAQKLAGAGADFLICPDNTVHQAFDRVERELPLPWIHIAEAVARVAVERGHRRLGVLGTRWLMEGPVYRTCLGERGLTMVIPEAADRERIDAIIFGELVAGRVTDSARRCLEEVTLRLKSVGCDSVVLGCTELPLLVSGDADLPLPSLDSTRILAREALRRASDGGATFLSREGR
jgi:aspartate racemase